MQNKGIVKFIAVALILVCCFYLSFSFVTRHYESKAEALRAELGNKAAEEYLDSVSSEDHVWLWQWSLDECREMEIGLGLDLKGGMNVILEVSVPDIVKTSWLATSTTLTRAIAKPSTLPRPMVRTISRTSSLIS